LPWFRLALQLLTAQQLAAAVQTAVAVQLLPLKHTPCMDLNADSPGMEC
jgi:hypothetical protein